MVASMDTYLLGAGFSKAIFDSMPTMWDLGQEVIEGLSLDEDTLTPFGDDVEAWLSHLSGSQPWNTEDVDLANRSMFVRASKMVTKVIEQKTPKLSTLDSERKEVLLRLVSEWSVNQSSVLTFNYDLIVEEAVAQCGDYNRADLYALPLTSRWPAGTAPFLSGSPTERKIPTLYKLHGSVNWLHGGLEHPYAPVVLRNTAATDSAADAHLYDDLIPMVIPPTSSKSEFYSNTALRSQWRNAFLGLKKADRLIIMGYSMPQTDLQVRTMLGLALAPGTEVIVIDRSEVVSDRIKRLFPTLSVSGIHSDDPITDFVKESCGYVAHRSTATESNDVRKEFLTINGETICRSLQGGYSANSNHIAVNQLARKWPSIEGSWAKTPQGDLMMHVSRSDYASCPNPWRDEA